MPSHCVHDKPGAAMTRQAQRHFVAELTGFRQKPPNILFMGLDTPELARGATMNVLRANRAIVLTTTLLISVPTLAAEPVTTANFARAETDWVMAIQAKTGCFAKLCSEAGPAALDKQQVIRMNRDTPYSRGVFDLTSPVTITLPDAGGRFQSLQVVNQDHFVTLVAYKPGTYTLTRENTGTRYAFVIIRTFIDPASPADVKAGHKVQSATTASQASPGRFEIPDWDQAQRAKLHDILISMAPFVPPTAVKFGAAGEVDPLAHLVGTAAGWGANPARDATYLFRGVAADDGTTPHTLTVGKVPVDGFWSITVYNAQGYYEAPENAISVNNVTARKNKDGTTTVRFGGDPKAPNYLHIMPGWNYTVRLYRPRAEVLDGRWTFPEPVPVK
jgi:hypothetical protein